MVITDQHTDRTQKQTHWHNGDYKSTGHWGNTLTCCITHPMTQCCVYHINRTGRWQLTESAILARTSSGMVSPLALSFLLSWSNEASITSMQIITSPCTAQGPTITSDHPSTQGPTITTVITPQHKDPQLPQWSPLSTRTHNYHSDHPSAQGPTRVWQ